MSSRPTFKIFGERNTGTNYLRRLIDSNLDGLQLPGTVPHLLDRMQRRVADIEIASDLWFTATERANLGWKHRYIDADGLSRSRIADDVHFVLLVKNPYAWVASMAARPYHSKSCTRGSTIEQLCTNPWPTVRREHGPAAYRSIGDMWNQKVRGYLSLPGRFSATLIRYEDLVHDPESELDRIATDSGSRRYFEEFRNLSTSTKNADLSFEDYSTYYGTEGWRESLTDDDVRLIDDTLDESLVSRLGYRWT